MGMGFLLPLTFVGLGHGVGWSVAVVTVLLRTREGVNLGSSTIVTWRFGPSACMGCLNF